jgi:hypothetical protein
MKILLPLLVPLLLMTAILGTACSGEAPLERATVNAAHAALRSRDSTMSRTLKVMEPGERVEILEQQGRWYRVRFAVIEGWMDSSTLLTDSMRNRIQENINSALNQKPQNTGTLRQDGNLRVEPGRNTAILRRLPARSAVEILERRTVPREDPPARPEPWLKVRSSPTEVGWILATFVEFDVPDAISRYTEEYTYSAVQTLHQIEDPVLGTIKWYVVAERRGSIDPTLDFTGIRVFTWNTKMQRYETAYRKGGFRGVYPLEASTDSGNPAFRFFELGTDGKSRQARNFVINGVVVREVRKPG